MNREVVPLRVSGYPTIGHSEAEAESSNTPHHVGDGFLASQMNDSVYELYRPSTSEPDLDILFFHGLQLRKDSTPHLSTWKSRCAESDAVIWPKHWLSEDFPTARILTISYDGSIERTAQEGRMDLYLIAENLLQALLLEGVGKTRPVILVGHCLGGLIIKELCLHWARREIHTFSQSIKGTFYMATPHKGSRFIDDLLHDLQKYNIEEGELVNLMGILNKDTARLDHEFQKLRRDLDQWQIRIAGVGERNPTELRGKHRVIVDEASARHDNVEIFFVEEDHFSICQPRAKNSTTYKNIVDFIRQVRQTAIVEDCEGDKQILPRTRVGLLASWERAEEIQRMLEENSAIGLWGVGGIGKTTLCKAIFNRKRVDFEYSLFIENIKLITSDAGDPRKFEGKLLDHVYHRGKKVEKVADISIFRGKDSLVVFDDIRIEDDRDIDVIRKLQDICSPRSRFILTSRDREILRKVDGLEIIQMELLDDDDAERLFRSFALPHGGPLLEWQQTILEDIVKYCDGLPLILEVLGQYLKTSEDQKVWEQLLTSLRDTEIQTPVTSVNISMSKLKLSIDTLGKEEKQMFIDIATIFHYGWFFKEEDYMDSIGRLSPWESWGSIEWTLRKLKATWRIAYRAEDIRWKTLVDRSLVFPVEDEDSEINLRVHSIQMQSVHSIQLQQVMDEGEEDLSLKLLSELEDGGPRPLSLSSGSLQLQKMNNLKYLQFASRDLRKVNLPKSLVVFVMSSKLEYFSFESSTELAVLSISSFVGKQLPDNFHSFKNSLQFLNLKADFVVSLPESFSCLTMLQECSLQCPLLKGLPNNFGNLPNLKKLRLKCNSLRDLPSSFCNLRKLQNLELKNCEDLKELPQDLGCLKTLEHLHISAVHGGIEDLPDLTGLKILQTLSVRSERLERLPDTLGNLERLQCLRITCHDSAIFRCIEMKCHGLRTLPSSIGKLKELKEMTVCSYQLEALPDSLLDLAALQMLSLQCGRLKSLPAPFSRLTRLKAIELGDLAAHFQPSTVNELATVETSELERQQSKSLPVFLPEMKTLKVLRVSFCEFNEIPDWLGTLGALRELDVSFCEKLKSLPESLSGLTALQSLEVQFCPKLEALPDSLGQLFALQELKISWCEKLKSLPESLSGLTALQILVVEFCPELEALPDSLGQLFALQELKISLCDKLKSLPESLSGLTALQGLEVEHCAQMKALPESLGQLFALTRLTLISLPIRKIPSLYAMSSLKYLNCSFLTNLVSLPEVRPGCNVWKDLDLS